MGTLRFDLNSLASAKSKEEKKAALALRKDFIRSVSWLGGCRCMHGYRCCAAAGVAAPPKPTCC